MATITILLLFCGAQIIKATNNDFAVVQPLSTNEEIFEYEEDQLGSNELTGIIGGKQASIQNYPYICAVITRTAHEGAGAILNKDWIVTSAWNLKDEFADEVLVRCGSNSAIINGQPAWAAKLIQHSQFDHFKNDVALIKLKTSLKFDKTVQPITIGPSISGGQLADLAGFGTFLAPDGKKDPRIIHDGYLRSANFRTISNANCKKYYKSESTFSKNNFCTKVSSRTGPCAFESGDPLVYKKKLVGLYSGATKCGDSKYPAVFTDLSKYKAWIDATIKKGSMQDDVAA